MRNTIVLAFLLLTTFFESAVLSQARQQNGGQHLGKRNHPPVITSFEVSSGKILLCPWLPGGSCTVHDDGILSLAVSAKDQDGDELVYKYSANGGRIEGNGPNVTWNLKDVVVGKYTAHVTASDRRGGVATSSTTVDIEFCGACDGPPCPALTVSAPSQIEEGRLIVFAERIPMGDRVDKPTYTWTVTAGKIVTGQGTPEIQVDTSGLGGRRLVATVEVGGLSPACNRQTSASAEVLKKAP